METIRNMVEEKIRPERTIHVTFVPGNLAKFIRYIRYS